MSLRNLILEIDRSAYLPVLVFGDGGNARFWEGEEVYEFPFAGFDNFDFFPAAWNIRWLFHLSRFMLHFPFDVVRSALILRTIKPTVVHINAGQAVTFGLIARFMGFPVIWHVRELVVNNVFGKLLDVLYRFCSRYVISPSQAVACRLPRCAVKVRIIPNAVRMPPSHVIGVDDLRQIAGLEEGDFVVLLLGNNLVIPKGYSFLAEVAHRLSSLERLKFLLAGHDEDPPVPAYHRFFRRVYRLKSGGEGEKEFIKRCWKQMTDQRRAWFTGYIDRHAALAACSVVVCPNLVAEPFGRTVIEAYAQAKPVIAMNLPALNEIVIDGSTGWLLPPVVDDWVKMIGALYIDPERVSHAAQKAMERSSLYRADIHAMRVVELYDEILR